MAEISRAKKPKQRKKSPEVRDRPVVVNGIRLPDAPTHSMMDFVREETSSPEPEEQILTDDEVEEATEAVEEKKDEVIKPLERKSSQQDKTEKPKNLIFPRSMSLQTDIREAPPIPARASVVPQYPMVPELSELPTYRDALNHPKVYSPLAPLAQSQSATQIYPEKVKFVEPAAPPLYPTLSTYECDQNGLLTEHNLLQFYHNPLYEAAESFENHFVETQQIPVEHGKLFPLLARFKEACDQISITNIKTHENAELMNTCFRECWNQRMLSINAKGTCGENNSGSGVGVYHSYELNEARLEEMKRLLTSNRLNQLDHSHCGEVILMSIELQIQWIIISINSGFMSENQLTIKSAPLLLEHAQETPNRTALRNALSDLFYHLRYPRLSDRYCNSIKRWINELMSVFNMALTRNDGIFVLCHLLRLPSPIHEWAPSLIQTFIQSKTMPRIKLDYCLAIMTHLLNPIKAREAFLRHIAQSEKEESTWEILADDADDEAKEFSFVTINETDLTFLLKQVPIHEIYSIANLAFVTYADASRQFSSFVAFQILLMKILDNGLTNYAKPGYKLFCKQIGVCIKRSVLEMCTIWSKMSGQLSDKDEKQLQNEVDRIILLSLNYLIHRDSVGLFQFVVSLPYECASEECRKRCEFVLRSNRKMSIKEIYEARDLDEKCQSLKIKSRLENLQPQDAEFLINSIATIGAHSNSDVYNLFKEIIDVCFCDESHRDELYKVGSEAIGEILTRRPNSLDQLLSIIDRNLDHMDSYAINVLSTSRLLECRLSESMCSIIGKWLINHPPEHGGNRLARRVFSGLYWGPSPDGTSLWIDADVHAIAADTVVKAHSVHCSRSNSMISKSLKQIAKLASKVGDNEAHFQQFCWDLLIKLKLPKNESTAVQNDLTAYYVNIVQKYESSVESYLKDAVGLFNELAASGSSVACVVLICRFIAQHYKAVEQLANDKPFMALFEKILHVDQLSYAAQWWIGPTQEKTSIVRLICSAIAYYGERVTDTKAFITTWAHLLCVARSGWNEDAVTYQILGTIVQIAMINDSENLYDLKNIMHQVYNHQLATEKNASKGFFNILSADIPCSPLVPDTMLHVAPLASYLMLLVENEAFGVFYGHLFDALGKKEKNTLEYAVKKAASKSSMTLPVCRITALRWARLAAKSGESPILPLILQQLAKESYKLRKSNTNLLCFARKIIDSAEAQPIMDECRKAVEKSSVEMKGLGKAVIGWLFTRHEVTRTGFDFSVFDLDYLLQLILAGDEHPWMDFVNIAILHNEHRSEQKLYMSACQLSPKSSTVRSNAASPVQRGLVDVMPFPSCQRHVDLAKPPFFDGSQMNNYNGLTHLTSPIIQRIRAAAKVYDECGARIERDDDAYCEIIRRLYQTVQQTIPVKIRCGGGCSKPSDSVMQVSPNVFNAAADAELSMNREKRAAAIGELSTSQLKATAIACASLEHLARLMSDAAARLPPPQRDMAQSAGHNYFYLIVNSIGENELLFAPAIDAYSNSLRAIGMEFVRRRAEEQMGVMTLALDGFMLHEPIVEIFTPEVLNYNDLCAVYKKMSEAVRKPEKSSIALQLLGRIGIDKASIDVPSKQFSALLPVAFANLASQPDPTSALYQLCFQHFVFFMFHHFPDNLCNGLELALNGCNSNSTPVALLDAIVDKLNAGNFVSAAPQIGAIKAIDCSNIITKCLEDARQRLPNLYNVWGRYMNGLTRLAQSFLFIPIRDGYQVDIPATVLQRELYDHFMRIVMLFNPLIAPYSTSHPPFSPSHETQAMLVLDRFIELLNALPYNASIPPGMQNVQAIVWKYYYEKISKLISGTEHYYNLVERQFVSLKWDQFWPSKLSVDTMDDCLDKASPDCAPFISQIVVRIPWKAIIQQIDDEARMKYSASLFCVIVRIVSNMKNYERVRASLLELLRSLSQMDHWEQVSPDDAMRIATIVKKCLPADSAPSLPDTVSVTQLIWRKLCNFSPRTRYDEDVGKKQKIWLRTECELLLKCEESVKNKAYSSLISSVHVIATNHENLRAFCDVARELTLLWRNITDLKLGESLVNIWTEFLNANPKSPLVLTCVNTLIDSLNSDQISTALVVIEKTIEAYFHRNDGNWEELEHWIRFPMENQKAIKSYLMTIPSSENKVTFLPLTLKAFMDCGASENLFFELHSYLTNIKPKHVYNESALVCLLARLIRWMSYRCKQIPSHFSPTDDLFLSLIQWIAKARKDESGFIANFMNKKRTSHKLRTILHILELYLTQQSLGEGKRPRCETNSPVLNSRISTLKELASQKANHHMSASFNSATSYFVQVDTYNILSTEKMLLDVAKPAYGDKYLENV